MDTVKIVMKELLDAGLIHGDCLTVTGKTVAENLKDVPKLSELDPQVKFLFYIRFNIIIIVLKITIIIVERKCFTIYCSLNNFC